MVNTNQKFDANFDLEHQKDIVFTNEKDMENENPFYELY